MDFHTIQHQNQTVVQNKSPYQQTVLSTDPPIENKTIFFIHVQRPKDKTLNLIARSACAIESAAKNNPDFNVTLVCFNVMDLAENNSFVKALKEYPNIQFHKTTLENITKDSIAEPWISKGLIQKGKYLSWHTSDFARLFMLYKYGGIYLDTDFIVLKSLADLKPGWTVAESRYWVASAAMSFHSTGYGHYLAEMLVREFMNSYNGSVYSYNGPQLLTRVLQKVCFTKDTKMMKRGPCYDFEVLARETFYPIGFYEKDLFFNPSNLTQALEKVKDSYAVHCWHGGYLGGVHLKVGTQAAIGVLAEKHCPKVYAAVEELF
ncbi:lactosylceramide 4-alpha-galactosyltransferase-like [Culicoides brevitarsis]|uniref:lactosylceramide 4-alpha-galactosyltransferase-like n=1 Tax=Culicoides brevitarsis TaxID=469753 RepID=UPI00307B4D97